MAVVIVFYADCKWAPAPTTHRPHKKEKKKKKERREEEGAKYVVSYAQDSPWNYEHRFRTFNKFF